MIQQLHELSLLLIGLKAELLSIAVKSAVKYYTPVNCGSLIFQCIWQLIRSKASSDCVADTRNWDCKIIDKVPFILLL